MLGRKQSLRGELVLADYGADEFSFAERSDILFINQHWVRIVLRSCALLSLVSICLNTPDTYKKWTPLIYVTFAIDFFVTLVFTAELLAKLRTKGVYQGEQAYFRDRWCQFDAVMWFFLVFSVILHVRIQCSPSAVCQCLQQGTSISDFVSFVFRRCSK